MSHSFLRRKKGYYAALRRRKLDMINSYKYFLRGFFNFPHYIITDDKLEKILTYNNIHQYVKNKNRKYFEKDYKFNAHNSLKRNKISHRKRIDSSLFKEKEYFIYEKENILS